MNKPFLENVTRKRTLAAEGKVLRGLATGIGAMFRGLRGKSYVLVWHRCGTIDITNVFVPEPLDIVWVDESLRIVDLHERFPAGAFRTTNREPARYVLELPAGTIAATKTKKGDKIRCAERLA